MVRLANAGGTGRSGSLAFGVALSATIGTLLLAPIAKDHGLHGGDALAALLMMILWLIGVAAWAVTFVVWIARKVAGQPDRRRTMIWWALAANALHTAILFL